MPQTGSTTSVCGAWDVAECFVISASTPLNARSSGSLQVEKARRRRGDAMPRPPRLSGLLRVIGRVGVELRLTGLGAKVIRLAGVPAGPCGLCRIHLHAAHHVFFHGTSPSRSENAAVAASLHRVGSQRGPQVQFMHPCSAQIPHDSVTRFLSASRALNTRTPALLADRSCCSANALTG